jgi:hypothetical protein
MVSVVNGATETLGWAMGAVAVCYAVNGIASMGFPPAAVLAAYCPAIGAASGGGNIAVQAAHAFAK